MTNANEPAFPQKQSMFDSDGEIRGNTDVPGLTKRELFAAMAMEGLCDDSTAANDIAKWSVEMADALIEALGKEG